jgi:sterol desaturase/sphingolipid hydroxylase (fatty acid hydroxylase superfamily)
MITINAFDLPVLGILNFLELTIGSTVALALRYVIWAGIAWLLGYWLFKRRWFHRKIVARFPQSSEVWREVRYSALSMAIFGLVAAATVVASRHGYTQIYWTFSKYSWTWFWLSIVCTILLHDTYFYWTHRLMHHPKLFRWFHRVHHLSHNPTPWASYAFAPLEAVVQAGILPLAAIIMPLHPLAFAIFMGWQFIYNVAGHTGYELHPRWLMDTPLRFFVNTPTNHAMHHESMRGNYGIYFNIWDRLMGTNHADYEKRFREVTSRPRVQEAEANSANSFAESLTSKA